MKIFNLFFFCFLFITVVFYSCKKKDTSPEEATTTTTQTAPLNNINNDSTNTPGLIVKRSPYAKKWIVDSEFRAENEYLSFEFSPYGSFVITKTDSTQINGEYVFDEAANSIRADSIGEISIDSLSSIIFNFLLTSPSGTSITISSTQAPIADSSAKTMQVARDWQLEYATINGVEYPLNYELYDSSYLSISPYGTWIMEYVETSNLPSSYESAPWSWIDANQNVICIGPWPICGSTYTITLTDDNKLVRDYGPPYNDTIHQVFIEREFN